MDDVTIMFREIDRAIEEESFQPSDWERDFLERVRGQWNVGAGMSPAQDSKLEEIWKKATSNG